MAFLTAGNIKLADPLKDPMKDIGAKRQASLEEMLGRVGQRNRAGQIATGRPRGEYTGRELEFAGDISGREIDDALYGSLGGASYKDVVNEQEHQRKMALAKRIGKSLAPSLGQEILGGIGMAGQVAPALIGAGKSAYDYFRPSVSPSYGSRLSAYGPTSNLNPGLNLESLLGSMNPNQRNMSALGVWR